MATGTYHKQREIQYKINKNGVRTYLQYKRRIEASFDLNLHKRFPERVDFYSGITKQGALELGLEAGEETQLAELRDMDRTNS